MGSGGRGTTHLQFVLEQVLFVRQFSVLFEQLLLFRRERLHLVVSCFLALRAAQGSAEAALQGA